MKKLSNTLAFILILSLKIIPAVTIPKDLYITDKIKKDIEEVSKLKINKKFSTFAYDSAFAKNAGLDIKKSVKLSENVHGVGISIEELKPETKTRFADYQCNIFFIIKNRNDYWLPKDSFGSWFEARKISDELEEMTGVEYIPYGHVVNDYSMREFVGPSAENLPPSKTINGGSVVLEKYIKDIYPGMSYVNFKKYCSSFPEYKTGVSVWLEKSSGPDFQIQTAVPIFSKFFYELNVPNDILKTSCKYIQKSASNKNWNLSIRQSEIGFPNSIRLMASEDSYQCI